MTDHPKIVKSNFEMCFLLKIACMLHLRSLFDDLMTFVMAVVVVLLQDETQKNRPGVTTICFYCVALGHMFLLFGFRWLWTICFYWVALGHMFLLCGARPYVSVVWRSAICFYCVCVTICFHRRLL